MATIRTGYSCPNCKKQTGDLNEVLADNGKLACSKFPEKHSWGDHSDFLDAGPTVDFAQEKQKPAPQRNHTSVNVSVPVPVMNALQNRYGDKMDATLSGQLAVLAEGETMILSDSDVQRMSQHLPSRPKNGSHLVGMIFSMYSEIAEAKKMAEDATKDLKAFEGISVGKTVVDLADQYPFAVDRARAEGLPLSVWLSRAVKNALENAWF
jgi:hypothetical protein